MTDHKTGARAEWLAARLELPEAEKAPPGRNETGGVRAGGPGPGRAGGHGPRAHAHRDRAAEAALTTGTGGSCWPDSLVPGPGWSRHSQERGSTG
jgi:hypothetical protein